MFLLPQRKEGTKFHKEKRIIMLKDSLVTKTKISKIYKDRKFNL